MKVFWAKGYECAQINDFTAAIGITPPSFYAAFESKETAFREAVDFYRRTVAAGAFAALETAPDLRSGLRAWLEQSADLAFACPQGGCMVSISAIQCKPENNGVRTFLKSVREANHARLKGCFETARSNGELASDSDPDALTEFFNAVQQSLSYEARDGSSRETVQKIIEMAMRSLPAPC